MRLVDCHWKAELHACAQAADGPVTLVSPFVTEATTHGVLNQIAGKHPVRLVTRFNLRDVASRVSDLGAMRRILDRGGGVRGIHGLHAKVYVFGASRAVVTSANLTGGGLGANQEFGCISGEPAFVARCTGYVEQLWADAATDLTYDQLADWERMVLEARLAGATVSVIDKLPDLGTIVSGQQPEPAATSLSGDWTGIDWPTDGQAFIKMFGEGDDLSSPTWPVRDEVIAAKSYAWCTYPTSKRPRQPKTGDTMFLGRLTTDGLRIFGRALALEHDDTRDEATDADIALREWLKRFPLYVRVFRVEALDSTLGNGFPVSDLIAAVGTDAFRTTRERARAGETGINPNLSLRQQASVQLTRDAADWCHRQLQERLELHGRISDGELQAWRDRDPLSA